MKNVVQILFSIKSIFLLIFACGLFGCTPTKHLPTNPINATLAKNTLLANYFQRYPYENKYHGGTFTEAADGNLEWRNDGDYAWLLKPDFGNSRLDATISESNPYKDDENGKAFKLVMNKDELLGFVFMGDIYQIKKNREIVDEKSTQPSVEGKWTLVAVQAYAPPEHLPKFVEGDIVLEFKSAEYVGEVIITNNDRNKNDMRGTFPNGQFQYWVDDCIMGIGQSIYRVHFRDGQLSLNENLNFTLADGGASLILKRME